MLTLVLMGTGGLLYSFSEASTKDASVHSTPAEVHKIVLIATTTDTSTISIVEDAIEDDEGKKIDKVTPASEEIPKKVTAKKNSVIEEVPEKTMSGSHIATVPFYSQFADITAPEWKKIGCGIASLAMLINYYESDTVSVDALLGEGIKANAYISNAGWSHAGLIGLSKKYGLSGSSQDLARLNMSDAFTALKKVLRDGPVMVSVHYTFDPKNPIPHLVVINGVKDGKVFYNDPAEKSGGNSISIEQFQSAWKKRYIAIRPV